MTWFKVDDNLAFHAKTVAAGVAAMGLWVRAGAWSAQQLTDGYIPEHMIPPMADGQVDLAAKLVSAGLWRKVRDGFQFHEWGERNPDAKLVKEKRRKEAERKAEWRAAQADKASTSQSRVNGHEYVPAGQVEDNSVRPDVTSAGVPTTSRATRPGPSRPVLTTQLPTLVDVSTTTSADADGQFDDFWKNYPKRVQKQDALKAWRQQLKRRVTPAEMIAGAQGYAEQVRRENRITQFIKHPGPWLRAGGYADHQPEPEAAPDTREPRDILRAHWTAGDVVAVKKLIGDRLPWVDDDPPLEFTGDRARFLLEQRRKFINEHFDKAIAAINHLRESA